MINMIKEYYQKKQDKIQYSMRFIIPIISVVIFLELFIKRIKVKQEKIIDSDRCIREYMENKCNEIKIDDGPIINDFCDEKRKCIKDNTICLIDVIKQYIKDFFSIKSNKIFNICLILVLSIIIILYNMDKIILFIQNINPKYSNKKIR